MNGAALLLHQLSVCGVRHIFGFPGESTLPLAIAAQEVKGLSHVLGGCERCAGYMADGYARFADRLAACYAPGGIGSPHLLPAILEARNSSIPAVFISTSQALSTGNKWATSTFDHHALGSTAKANFVVREVRELAHRTADAVACAATPRTGPTHLDVSSDVLEHEAGADVAPVSEETAIYPRSRQEASEADIYSVVDAVLSASRPILLVGGGCQLSRVPTEIVEDICERLGMPVVVTLNAKGLVREKFAGFLGVIGQKGHSAANNYARSCDVVICVGSKMGDKSSLNWTLVNRSARFIQVDVDEAELGRAFPAAIKVRADARSFLEQVGRHLAQTGKSRAAAIPAIVWPAAESPIAAVCAALSTLLDGNDCLISDASQSCGWMGVHFQSSLSARGTTSPRGTGSIGYALPAAIGASFARPNSRVVAIGGDGGLMIAMHEMETAARLACPLTFILLNNGNRLGLLEAHLRHLHGSANVLAGRKPVNWEPICKAFGWAYVRYRADQVTSSLRSALGTNGPTLFDVPADDSLPPDFANTVALAKVTA